MKSSDIRRTFLEFFRERDHRIWPSSSLIPNDPTLLLTIAGMVQFKPYLMGEATPEHPRAASVQKCARTNDIENVGVTTRHFTVFEMLGNWSFGDYFKREAIAWAWELSTQGFGFDPERIWVTVFEDDDESAEFWLSETDVPAERIQRVGVPEGATRLDASDNFWSTHTAGPSGPCTELYYDRGPEHGRDGGPIADEERYLEFWNLVFMQYEQDDEGNIIGELPARHVDTGMGLERMAMLLQGVPNAYETDVMRPMIDRASELTGVPYGEDSDRDVSLRVIAEHSRACAFLIADGVLPSNEARGYVLRRLLRRAVRHARLIGHDRPVMPAMMDCVRTTLGDAWPELEQQFELINRVATAEEESFAATLRSGMTMLSEAIAAAKDVGATSIDADTAFKLHDTYGFPVDLTIEIAQEEGLELDRDAFAAHMEAQRARARAAQRAGRAEGPSPEVLRAARDHGGPSDFIGYTDHSAETRIAALLAPDALLDAAQEGDEVWVTLPRTPFYAEGGGQLGDHGEITTDTGRLKVVDTIAPLHGLTVHRAIVEAGEVRPGQPAHAAIDTARRSSIARGHTATHILHATIKEVLGDHAVQAGSAIDAGRFRFDFPHFEPVSRDALQEVEGRVNERIAAAPPIDVIETTPEDARRMGAVALFGEKYGERVRVVRIGDFSTELCGGTHVRATPEVGLFTILSEGSIAANVRRIEAVTGPEAFQFLTRERLVADAIARMLKVGTDEAAERVAQLLARVKELEKELARQRERAVLARAEQILAGAERVGDVALVGARVDDVERDALKALATELRNRAGRAVVVVGSRTPDGKAALFAAVSPDLHADGLTAADVLRPGAQVVGGGAGGKGDTAQAGGRDAERLDDAIRVALDTARERLPS